MNVRLPSSLQEDLVDLTLLWLAARTPESPPINALPTNATMIEFAVQSCISALRAVPGDAITDHHLIPKKQTSRARAPRPSNAAASLAPPSLTPSDASTPTPHTHLDPLHPDD
jgi:hypothetical protein